jgi:hypothetical protein
MRHRMRLHMLVGSLVVCGVLGPAVAAGVLASTVPGIPGDGQDEDTPYLPAGVPTIHVHVFPHWFGSVVSKAGGGVLEGYISCPKACQRPVGVGSHVTLHETPTTPGGVFLNWSGVTCAPPTTQTSQDCLVIIAPDATEIQVIANYKDLALPPPGPKSSKGGGPCCTLTVTVSSGGCGATCWVDSEDFSIDNCASSGGTCSATYAQNSTHVLTATTTNRGFTFDHWTGCDVPSGDQCTMHMNSNKNVGATFSS